MLTAAAGGAKLKAQTPLRAMSEEQLAALLAKLKDDAVLQEKLQGAADLDAFLAIAKEAGFNISKADWLEYQDQQTLELSDEELEKVSGGVPGITGRGSVLALYEASIRVCRPGIAPKYPSGLMM